MLRPATTYAVAMTLIIAVSAAARSAETEDAAKIAAGGQTFVRYCALCHGIDAAGSGPLAESLQKAPPDLTRLAERNAGVFPEENVKEIIEKGGPKSHGMMAMLSWGKVFNEDLGKDSRKVIDELTAYIKSLQGR